MKSLYKPMNRLKRWRFPLNQLALAHRSMGGELLLLSLATCFCNDIYREASNRNITVSGVEVEFTGEFGAEGESGSNFTYTANVMSDAPPADIEALINYTDQIAEIHNTLRKGLSITLAT